MERLRTHLALGLIATASLFFWGCPPKQAAVAPVAVTAEPLPQPPALPTPPRKLEFIILQFNDVYEISPLDNGKVGGMARVATIKKQLEQTGRPVITVLDGDYLSPSLLGTLSCNFPSGTERVNGRHMVEVLNQLGTNYVTFGNHEFDLKEKDLNARDAESKFTIISNNCINVVNGEAGKEAPFKQGDRTVPEYVIHSIPNGMGDTLKLGLIGTTLEFTQQKYLKYADPFQATKESFDAVRTQSDVVMGITHLSMDEDIELAQKVPGMPLIMGGHEHQNMTKQVGGTFIAKADANVKTLYLHWCTYDFETKQLNLWSQLYPITDAIPSDPAMDALVKKWEAFGDECMKQQGYAPYDSIGFAFTPLDGRDGSMRYGQTNLGFLICDAFRQADTKSDLAIMNSGSVRIDDQIAGFVVQKHILACLPFGGDIKRGQILGDSLRKILDTGLDPKLDGNGAHLQYSSNLTRSGSTYTLNGKPLDGKKLYTLTLPGFLADGGEKPLAFIKGMSTWGAPDLKAATAAGLVKNDVRDITIWAMKQSGQMTQIRAMMK